jgi:hypothetical protein
MKQFFIVVLASAVCATLACERQETKTVETETRTETSPAGQPIEKESETASRLPGDGKIDAINAEHNEYVGVVTDLDPGKSLTIEAVNGEKHRFDLNERGSAVTVPASVKKGAKVKVTVDKHEDKPQTVTVSPAS